MDTVRTQSCNRHADGETELHRHPRSLSQRPPHQVTSQPPPPRLALSDFELHMMGPCEIYSCLASLPPMLGAAGLPPVWLKSIHLVAGSVPGLHGPHLRHPRLRGGAAGAPAWALTVRTAAVHTLAHPHASLGHALGWGWGAGGRTAQPPQMLPLM